MQALNLPIQRRLSELQDIVEQLQASISRHSQLAASAAPLDLQAVLKYAHKIAYTSFAPLGHDHTQLLPQHFRPPNPQEWQLRASQLHQFQAEHDEKQRQAQAAAGIIAAAASQPEALQPAPQLPAGLSIPSMPKGWRPGMPIPGLEAAALLPDPAQAPATATVLSQPMPLQSVPEQQVPAEPSPVTEQPTARRPVPQPQQELEVQVNPALLPHPIIPDFELNPGMEAVEEEYSSSEGDEDDL